MATTEIQIPINEWTLISESSVYFQAKDNKIKVVESATAPNDNTPFKNAIVDRIYVFDKNDGNLYGYSEKGATVGVDPK